MLNTMDTHETPVATSLPADPVGSHMGRALALAERGRGSTSPNPLVGAVISAPDGRVIGEGFHARCGEPHAEREAIRDASERGEDPKGGTLHVTLEPCAHQGRQPPCTDAILESGISRVVYASEDPTEKASGRGPTILREAGVEVVRADAEEIDAADSLNQPFLKRATTGLPLVTYKAAMTLDGKVAAPGGDSRWISGSESRTLVHEMRGVCDAVAVGIGTVFADDPLLTARTGDGSDRSAAEARGTGEGAAIRVVFDRNARLPLDSALVASQDVAEVVVVASAEADSARVAELQRVGVEVVTAEGSSDGDLVTSGLQELSTQMEISDLLLEGGPRLAGAFLDAGQIDRLLIFIAPIVVGSGEAPGVIEGSGAKRIAEATRAVSCSHLQVGDDLLLDARLRRW
jgi:diaminohydroxyphosphoribosylaminopyrimidine deaminase/5-amino-6-(5-phosphoribosylamino)uracil reductase